MTLRSSGGLSQLNFEKQNKVEVAIMRLKEFEPPEGYYLAFSGGKDSVVIHDLAVRANIKFELHYHVTGIDPPELVQFIRRYYPHAIHDMPRMSLFKALGNPHGFPTRQHRWCCELLKETHGHGRIITGIRWQESPGKRGKRRLFEVCKTDTTKFYLSPIIDWTSKDIWTYLREFRLPYCYLYDFGSSGQYKGDGHFKRLGCVLCPMVTARQTRMQLAQWPKLAEAWHRAFQRFYALGWDSVKRWEDAEAMWQWWLSRKGESKVDNCQGRFV